MNNASLLQEKLLNTSEYHILQLDDGIKKENYNANDYHLVTESLTSVPIKKKLVKKMKQIESPFCIPESLVINKKMMQKDKKNILKIKSEEQPKTSFTFKISHPDSISREKDYSEFWMQSKKEKYNELSWLPKIDWLGLASTSSSGYATSTIQKSWFSMTTIKHQQKNLEKISCPSYKFTVANGTEKEDTNAIIKTLKLRLFPTKEQKLKLNEWSSASRYTYNKTIASIKKNQRDNWMKLRNRFVTAKNRKGIKNNFFNNKKWLLETPKHIRLSAVKEAFKNLKTCFTNIKRKNIKTFDLTFKTKKKEIQNGWSLGLEKNNVRKDKDVLSIFPDFLGTMKYARKKQLHKLIPEERPDMDPRIQKDKFGDFYLLLACKKKIIKPKKTHTTVRSYDPGCKVFLTGYDPNGTGILLGKDCDEKILSLLEKLDVLISQRSICKYHLLDKKIRRLKKRIYNLKKELHNQVNSYVAKSSSLILYPKLDTKNLVLKEKRQLTTKTVRKMLHLGHCECYDKLKIKCKEHGSLLLTVSEAYTTKTCSCCGALNTCDNTRVYKCPCGYKAERDLHGAQNILLRSLES